MTESEFVSAVFENIRVGDPVKKPRSTSEILAIKYQEKIYYRIGKSNKKFVSKEELTEVFAVISSGEISIKAIRKIIPDSKPCNSTTIQWLLTNAKLANRSSKGSFTKSWN
ncbi:hypothetical protein [Shewanella nanhaiensis]|uniref:Uncharacterized protein n=1 Tax=Shewanella nanhaiensis TaxID=2864872 RepID=A0ABS7EAW3_9GAMM|nr:hypothetical protein [Shewanella nanhaiensis]MBW8186192.1 hypothetical protein [Shewanella nanhaiensis]